MPRCRLERTEQIEGEKDVTDARFFVFGVDFPKFDGAAAFFGEQVSRQSAKRECQELLVEPVYPGGLSTLTGAAGTLVGK